MNKFKKGDKIIINSTQNTRYWDSNRFRDSDKCIGYVFTLTKDEADGINIGRLPHFGDNKFGVNYQKGDWESFIEPKYKVGDKIFAFPKLIDSTDLAEIVKVSLNKKRKEYSYLAFTLESGMPLAMMESEIRFPNKEVVVRMTVKEVEDGFKVQALKEGSNKRLKIII